MSKNRWANLLLLDACKDLSESQLDAADIEGTFGSIQDTLLHLASAEGRYVWQNRPAKTKDFRGSTSSEPA